MVPPMSVGEPKDLRVVVIGAPKLDIVRVVVVNDTGFGSSGTMRVSSMFLSTNVKDGMWRLLWVVSVIGDGDTGYISGFDVPTWRVTAESSPMFSLSKVESGVLA